MNSENFVLFGSHGKKYTRETYKAMNGKKKQRGGGEFPLAHTVTLNAFLSYGSGGFATFIYKGIQQHISFVPNRSIGKNSKAMQASKTPSKIPCSKQVL